MQSNKKTIISLSLDIEIIKELKRLAKENDRSLSNFLNTYFKENMVKNNE